jgi:hypothetical protein
MLDQPANSGAQPLYRNHPGALGLKPETEFEIEKSRHKAKEAVDASGEREKPAKIVTRIRLLRRISVVSES